MFNASVENGVVATTGQPFGQFNLAPATPVLPAPTPVASPGF